MIVSTVPPGSGLSSSAALEVATYTFLEALSSRKPEKSEEKVAATSFGNSTRVCIWRSVIVMSKIFVYRL